MTGEAQVAAFENSENYTLPKINVPLVPPNPNEFLIAMLIDISLAVFAQ